MSIERKPWFKERLEPTLLSLSAAFLFNTVADVAAVLAVWPYLIVSGPTVSDTVSGALPYLAVMATAPLAGFLISRLIKRQATLAFWQAVLQLFRVCLAFQLLFSIGSDTAGATEMIFIAVLFWSLRLTELVLLNQFFVTTRDNIAGARTERLVRTVMALAPALSILIVCARAAELAPPVFALTSLSLNFLVFLSIASIFLFRSAGKPYLVVADQKQGSKPRASLTVYELALSIFSSLFLFVPVLLALTDHSQDSFVLRSDTLILLAGWISGTIAGGSTRKANSGIEIIHLLLTVSLAAMALSTSTAITMTIFFLAAFLASAIVAMTDCRINNNQNRLAAYAMPLRMTLLVVLTALVYFNLSASASVLPQSTVLRTLAMMCLAPLAMTIVVWRDARILLCRMVAHLIPFEKVDDLRGLPARASQRKGSTLFVTRNIDLITAMLLSFKLGVHTFIVTQDGILSEPLVAKLLSLLDISIVNREGSQGLYASFILKARLGEALLIHDPNNRSENVLNQTLDQLGMDPIGQSKSGSLRVALIERVNAPAGNCLVISELHEHERTSREAPSLRRSQA